MSEHAFPHVRTTCVSAVVAVGMGLLAGGCASTDHGSSTTARLLQQRVLAVATAAQERHYADALRQLTDLGRADDQALAQGAITQALHDEIAAAIVRIRADLTTLQAAARVRETPLPQPQPAPLQQHGDGHGGGNSRHGGDRNGNGGD